RRRAEAAARDLNEKYDIKSKLDRGAQAATDAFHKTGELVSSSLDLAREEISRVDRENKISETVTGGAKRAAGTVEEAYTSSGAKKVVDVTIDEVKSKTSEFLGGAQRYYDSASGAARAGTAAVRLPNSVLDAIASARTWMKNNPGKAAIVSLSFLAGTRAGSAFSGLDVAVLGAGGAGNWLFHSALVPYGLRKLSQKYEAYLRRQEELLLDGKLDEASQSRVKFERDLAKYAGAPLLGAFSIAAGAGLISEALTGGTVAGFPIGLVLGANPMLSSIWLFGNGLVCFHNGYKFFMMALADQPEVERVVRDVKGLLPSGIVGEAT
ncbi:MAG TPA: hypothetical protein VJX67_25975, partial [Blastocatellia bacterium]|nr:hypothetical protein [Blastocatellia bacterium]